MRAFRPWQVREAEEAEARAAAPEPEPPPRPKPGKPGKRKPWKAAARLMADERRKRDALIVQLAAQGLSAAQIAERVEQILRSVG
jgi:hypothetical protein